MTCYMKGNQRVVVLSLNNCKFGDFVDRIYPIELKIKDTTHTAMYASYLDLLIKIDDVGRLRTKLYDKRHDLKFPIVNFPFICSNISTAPDYGYVPFVIITFQSFPHS